MEKEKMINRIADEILFGIDSCEGAERILCVTQSLGMIYGAGYDEGRKSVQRRNRRKVIQLNLIGQPIKLWNSIGEAMHNTGTDRSSIGKCARGEVETAGGFKWRYADNN